MRVFIQSFSERIPTNLPATSTTGAPDILWVKKDSMAVSIGVSGEKVIRLVAIYL
jgi:hypothetical protein